MRYTRLLCFLTLAFTPLVGLADDQDLGPAIYLNNAPSTSSTQMDNDWDDTATTDENAGNNTVYPTKPLPEKHTYGPTKKEDHIWTLAEKLRPNTAVTIQQMIIALQRANPDAFDQGNINALKNGSILIIPSLTKIQAIAPETAKLLVQQQNQQWQQAQNSNLYFKVDNGVVNNKPTTLVISNTKPGSNIITSSQSQSSITPLAKQTQTNPVVMIPTVKPIAVQPVIAKAATLTNDISAVTSTLKMVPSTTIDPNVEVQTLEKELAADKKDFQNYRDQMTKQMVELEQENAAIQKQLMTEKKALNSLKENGVSKDNIILAPANTATMVSANQADGIASYLPKTKTGWWILWGALFLIVLLWLPSPKKKVAANSERQEPSLATEEEFDNKDIKDEYDFMNSLEAMPAKLDLARAYMDMDDYPSAENLLKEIIKKGNDAERKRARQMLKEAKVGLSP